jgi:hypothetical protein
LPFEKIEMLFIDFIEYSDQTNERTNEMETKTMTTTTTMSPAARAAALKREKKAAATAARLAGKIAAAEKRASAEAAWTEGLRKGHEAIEKKVEAARKAMGVRKNEPNPSGIRELKEKWEFEMMMALRNQVLGM